MKYGEGQSQHIYDVHVFVLMSDGHCDMFRIGGLYHDTDGIDDVGGYFVVPWTFIPTPSTIDDNNK